jgi:hypothetical protein
MPLSIREIEPGDVSAVRAFNSRLAEAGVDFTFPVSSAGLMQREPGVEAPFQTAYVMTDGAAVRGGYMLKNEQLFSHGECLSAGNYQLPLSEGIINRKYALVGVQLIKDALTRQARLYCLGMGSLARPLPRLLHRLGWLVSEVPFLFRIEHASNFTREIRWLRQRPTFRYLLDLSRTTGTLAALVALSRLRRRARSSGLPPDVSVLEAPSLPEDIDGLFLRVRNDYGLLCDRRMAAMRMKLPSQDARLSRLVLYRSGKLAGWVVLSISRLRSHKQFGDMTLGCIVDGLAAPADVGMLTAAACTHLEAAECDLLVSNQSHPAWISALRRQGFLKGPSNFILALSPELAACAPAPSLLHFTRADGDGPINL